MNADRTTWRASAMAVVAGMLAACAGQDTNHPAAPARLVVVNLQPARIPPNAQGALLLSVATGCYVEFVGKDPAEHAYRFRLAPTQRVPALPQCISSLRAQPGVIAVDSVQ
jgi:hypothetical protein